jgi:hypothetical protein
MHWNDYASVVGHMRIAQVRARLSPDPSKAPEASSSGAGAFLFIDGVSVRSIAS